MVEGEVPDYAFGITAIPSVASNTRRKPICFGRNRGMQHGFFYMAFISVAS
jgi:hypothetical protein